MLKKTFLALFLLPLLFTTACNKSDDTSASEFVINGVHDVNMSTSGGNVLTLSVAQSSGTQQQVTLSVTGLPTGITAAIDPASGTPAFTSTVTFSMNGAVAAGTYPVKITGTSASFTKSYDLNIVVAALNGWVLGSTIYRLSNMTHGNIIGFGYISMSSADNGSAILTASLNGTLPTADGTYTYKLVEAPAASDEMGISTIGGGDYTFTGNDHHTATMKITGGKVSLSFPATEVMDGTTTKMLTVMASE